MTALILLSEWQRSQVEFWRESVFEGYDVSSFGRVRSWWTIVANKGWSNGAQGILGNKPQVIQGAVSDSSGYPYLNVGTQNGKRPCPKIHRLVAETFIPNPENKPEINHINGRKWDNWIGNLEWATRLENMQHAARLGLRDNIMPKCEAHYGSKISDAKIIEMQGLYDMGIKPIQLAEYYSLTLANVYDLAKGSRGRGKTLREKIKCQV